MPGRKILLSVLTARMSAFFFFFLIWWQSSRTGDFREERSPPPHTRKVTNQLINSSPLLTSKRPETTGEYVYHHTKPYQEPLLTYTWLAQTTFTTLSTSKPWKILHWTRLVTYPTDLRNEISKSPHLYTRTWPASGPTRQCTPVSIYLQDSQRSAELNTSWETRAIPTRNYPTTAVELDHSMLQRISNTTSCRTFRSMGVRKTQFSKDIPQPAWQVR